MINFLKIFYIIKNIEFRNNKIKSQAKIIFFLFVANYQLFNSE